MFFPVPHRVYLTLHTLLLILQLMFVTVDVQKEIIKKATEKKSDANKKASELESMMKVYFSFCCRASLY